MEKIYKFEWVGHRGGGLQGLFIAEETELAALFGKEIYFGEVLGKHSEVCGELTTDDIECVTEDQDFIKVVKSLAKGSLTLCGYNPLDYYEPEDDEYDED